MPKAIRYAGARPKVARAQIQRQYDRGSRDPESKRFYNSNAWKAVRASKLQADPICERCEKEGRVTRADLVHHKLELRDFPELGLSLDNLESLCHACHNLEHKGKRR